MYKRQDDTVRVLGKGGKQRTVFLNDACLAALEQYLPKRLEPNEQDADALFVSKKRNRINVQTVKWLVKKYIGQAGLDPKKYSAHKLRQDVYKRQALRVQLRFRCLHRRLRGSLCGLRRRRADTVDSS